MPYNIKKIASSSIVSETQGMPPILLNNKVTVSSGWIQRIRCGGNNPVVKEYTQSTDLMQSATITYETNVADRGKEKDWNDDTAASRSFSGSASETDLIKVDLGTVKDIYLYAKHSTSASSSYSNIYVSTDGTTWTKIGTVSGASAQIFWNGSARYVKWTGSCTASAGGAVYLYSLEIFDKASATKVTSKTGNVWVEHEISTYDAKSTVILDGASPLVYSEYRISQISPTIMQVEVV